MKHLTTTPTSNFIFYRSYSRFVDDKRETWRSMAIRVILGLANLGKFTDEEINLVYSQIDNCTALPSGRYMWCGGTEWSSRQENYSGSYNCSSTVVDNIATFGYLMDLAMQGTGTGAVLELENIAKLPPIKTKINVEIVGEIGANSPADRQEITLARINDTTVDLRVGDSRRGWVESYVGLIQLAVSDVPGGEVTVRVDLSSVRPAGEKLAGFGGTANPAKLPELYSKIANILNGAIGRQLNSIECALLINEAALVVVAGNIRRSAGILQFSASDELAKDAKLGLWKQDESGNWYMPNPERDALRMANHTRVFHQKPSLVDCIESVRKQYYSGEGAIQWAGEAVARANADLLDTPDKKAVFLGLYPNRELARDWLDKLSKISGDSPDEFDLDDRMMRYGINPCALGSMELLTVDGYQTFESLDGKEVDIINASGQVSKSKVWCSGIKETIEITFEGRSKPLICTPDHQLMDVEGNTILAGESKGHRLMPFTAAPTHDPLYVLMGMVQGDGVLSDLSNPDKKGVTLCIGSKDVDFINVLDMAGVTYSANEDCTRVYINGGFSEKLKALGFSQKKLPERELPSTFGDWTIEQKKAFLNGVFTANGCIHSYAKGRISLKGTCKVFVDSIQSLLAEFNIQSYITTNKPKANKFYNGEYVMKQSYDLNIQQYFSRSEFSRLIGFSLDYKSDLLVEKLIETAPKVRLIRPYGKHKVYDFTEPLTHWGIVNTTVFHNCGEIIMNNNYCNLAEIHLNTIDPFDLNAQSDSFRAASLTVAALLHHEFELPRYQNSRLLDPIVGVSFTGLFDFFVHLFGIEWLQWWQAGRPKGWGDAVDIDKDNRFYPLLKCDFIRIHHFNSMSDLFLSIEEEYLWSWKAIVFDTVTEYCDHHGIKAPNRCTTVQPAGSKSLLTGASPGWHPPKASRYIRRMTFGRDEPLALAAIDMGYSVIPSQSDKDEDGNLLDDIHDPRVTEWLVEIPCATSWADMPGVDEINIGQFSALAQFDFYMQVQKHYTTHNTSATLELAEHEIEPLATAIYEDIQSDGGYMSAALLARFESLETFPRMPFEPIDKDRYQQELVNIRMRRVESDFDVALALHDRGQTAESGPSGCDSAACTLPERK